VRREVKTVTWVCDLCGTEYDDPYRHGQQVDVTLQVGVKAFNGDTGGATIHEWWCGKCYEDLQRWKHTRLQAEQ